ncbi:hypothetical protein ACCT30_51270, partial [Rhizobium ruizarguesonis]
MKVEKQAANNRLDDLVLNSEDVSHLAIEFLGKDMSASLCIDQLHRSAHALANHPNTTFEDEIRA